MKVDVWFKPDNRVSIVARNEHGIQLLTMEGITEEIKEELASEIKRLEAVCEAMRVALARILFTPISWD